MEAKLVLPQAVDALGRRGALLVERFASGVAMRARQAPTAGLLSPRGVCGSWALRLAGAGAYTVAAGSVAASMAFFVT